MEDGTFVGHGGEEMLNNKNLEHRGTFSTSKICTKKLQKSS